MPTASCKVSFVFFRQKGIMLQKNHQRMSRILGENSMTDGVGENAAGNLKMVELTLSWLVTELHLYLPSTWTLVPSSLNFLYSFSYNTITHEIFSEYSIHLVIHVCWLILFSLKKKNDASHLALGKGTIDSAIFMDL